MEKMRDIEEAKESLPSLDELKRMSDEMKEEISEIKRVIDGQESCRINGCNTSE